MIKNRRRVFGDHMKTIFIVNPQAGRKENLHRLVNSIRRTAEQTKRDADIYVTKAPDDARRFVQEYCEKYGAARFIACGGDGTLSEVLNGAIQTQNVEIGVIPIGTGNDFCRNFRIDGSFDNILLQMTGPSVNCDAIRYRTMVNGKLKTGYCANMFNIGFDCNVADTTAHIKKKRFIFGSMAYFISIFLTLIRKKCVSLNIEIDGKVRHDGKLLLTSLANGSYCGGGVKSNPIASVNDGRININMIQNISRLKFISLLPHYMKGTFLELPDIDRYISSETCETVKVTPHTGHMRLCIDGEITDAGVTEFDVLHKAFRFVLPVKERTAQEKELAQIL